MLGARGRWKMVGGRVGWSLLIVAEDESADGKLQTVWWQGLGSKQRSIMNQEKTYKKVNQQGEPDCKCNIIQYLRGYTYGVMNQEGESGAAMNRARAP